MKAATHMASAVATTPSQDIEWQLQSIFHLFVPLPLLFCPPPSMQSTLQGKKEQEYKKSQGVGAGRKRTRTLAQIAFDGLQFVLSKTIQLLGMLVASAIRALGKKLCVGHVDAEIVLRTPEKCLTRKRQAEDGKTKTESDRRSKNQCQTWDSKAPSLGGLAGTGPLGGIGDMMGAVDGRFFAMAPLDMVPWYVLSLPSYSFGNSQPGCARSLFESGAPRTEGPSFVGIGIASIEGM
jgi:hypothetical protein